MSYAQVPGLVGSFPIASEASADARVQFIKRTYAHLAGAILAFVALQAALFSIPGIERYVLMVRGMGWLIVLAAFIGASYLAERWANSTTSVRTQYLGLGLFVAAEAIITFPLIYIAGRFGGKNVIPAAAIMTLAVFGALSLTVFLTRKDFSFLGPALSIGGLTLLGMGLCGLLFGFNLEILVSGLGVALASGYVLYDTSNVIHRYRVGQHVAAALALFASIALMFWYILRLVMYLTNRR